MHIMMHMRLRSVSETEHVVLRQNSRCVHMIFLRHTSTNYTSVLCSTCFERGLITGSSGVGGALAAVARARAVGLPNSAGTGSGGGVGVSCLVGTVGVGAAGVAAPMRYRAG
jgi:hypothetical protein